MLDGPWTTTKPRSLQWLCAGDVERALLFPGTLETLPDGLASMILFTVGDMKFVFGGSKRRQIKHRWNAMVIYQRAEHE